MSELRESTGSPAPEETGGGVGSWILGIFTSPGTTFEQIAASTTRPHPSDPAKTKDMSKWWLPVIISIVVGLGVAIYTVPNFIMPTQADAIREAVMERGGAAADAEQAIAMSSKMIMPISLVGVIIGTFIIVFIFAGLAHLFMKMVGGKGLFRNARAVVAWSMLVSTLGSLIKLPLMMAKKSMFVETGPTLFFKNLEPSDKLYKFLSSFDIFTIWWVVLLVIGLAIGYRASRGKTAIAVVLLWILIMLVATFSPGGFGAGM